MLLPQAEKEAEKERKHREAEVRAADMSGCMCEVMHMRDAAAALQEDSLPCALPHCLLACLSATQEAKALKKAGFKDGEALKKSSAKFVSFFQVSCDSPAN